MTSISRRAMRPEPVLKADMELTHQYLDHNLLGVAGPAKEMTIDVKAWAKPQPGATLDAAGTCPD